MKKLINVTLPCHAVREMRERVPDGLTREAFGLVLRALVLCAFNTEDPRTPLDGPPATICATTTLPVVLPREHADFLALWAVCSHLTRDEVLEVLVRRHLDLPVNTYHAALEAA